MAFPASTTLLSTVLQSIAQIMQMVKASSQTLRNASAIGSVGANQIISYIGDLADFRDQLTALSATAGLPAYAQAQYNNQNLDIVAEYNATVAQIDATRNWIITNFPKAGTGELLEKKFDANGRVVLNVFTSVQLTNLRTQLDALIATIA